MENKQLISRKDVNLALLSDPRLVEKNSVLERKIIYMAIYLDRLKTINKDTKALWTIKEVLLEIRHPIIQKVFLKHALALKYLNEVKNRIFVLPFDYPRVHPLLYDLIEEGEKIMFTSFDKIQYKRKNPEVIHIAQYIDLDDLEFRNFQDAKIPFLQDKIENLRNNYKSDNNRYKKSIIDMTAQVYSTVPSLGAIYNITRIDALSKMEEKILEEKDNDLKIQRSIALDPISARAQNWSESFINSKIDSKADFRNQTDGKNRANNLSAFQDGLTTGYLLYENFNKGGLVAFKDDRSSMNANIGSKDIRTKGKPKKK